MVWNLFLSVSGLSCRLSFLLSLDNLLDRNLLHMFSFFDFLRCNRPGFFSDRQLFAARPVVSVSPPFRLGCFLLLNFNLLFSLNWVLSCFLGNLQLILVLLPCVDNFQYPCFSSSVQLLSSRHCSCRTFLPAVGTALAVLLILPCCWLCSFAS